MTVARRSAERCHLGNRPVEAHPLLLEQRRVGHVGRCEVGVHGVKVQVLTGEQVRQGGAKVVEPESEPVHAGVDLQVVGERALVPRRGGLHGLRGAWRRDRRRQVAVEQPVEIADAERAEHEDFRAHASRAQHGTFFDVRAREQVGASVLECASHLARAVSVGIGLHDRNHPRRASRLLTGEKLDDVAIVRFERVEVDACGRRTDQCDPPPPAPAARFSNLVNSRMNASFTTPVGPFRCLPMISSAVPVASEGGAFLSTY